MTTTPVQISRRQLGRYFSKIGLKNGDVLAVKAGTQEAKVEILQAVTDALGRVGKKDIIVVVVDDLRDLSVLDVKDMADQGWFRAPILRKAIHQKESNDANGA
jgi:hypothetical protein